MGGPVHFGRSVARSRGERTNSSPLLRRIPTSACGVVARVVAADRYVLRVELQRRIMAGEGGFLFYALTPPRLATSAARAQEIADSTLERLRGLELDGLVLYDIDEESDRNPEERPFPFLPTMDPAD